MFSENLDDFFQQTPLVASDEFSSETCAVSLKMDCCHAAGSFKIRGIALLCSRLVAQGKTHLISSSGGNAGLATAYAGRKLNTRVTVYVPSSTTPLAKQLIEQQGGTVVVAGSVWADANAAALEAVARDAERNALIHPFDDPVLFEGHASLVTEMRAQLGDANAPDAIVLAIGGGGMLGGVLRGLEESGLDAWRNVKVYACETAGAASFAAAKKAGEPVRLESIDTVATSLGASQVSRAVFEHAQRHAAGVESVVVSDDEAVDACRRLAVHHRALTEAACGAALAGAEKIKQQHKKIVVIVCGGIQVSFLLQQNS